MKLYTDINSDKRLPNQSIIFIDRLSAFKRLFFPPSVPVRGRLSYHVTRERYFTFELYYNKTGVTN